MAHIGVGERVSLTNPGAKAASVMVGGQSAGVRCSSGIMVHRLTVKQQ